MLNERPQEKKIQSRSSIKLCNTPKRTPKANSEPTRLAIPSIRFLNRFLIFLQNAPPVNLLCRRCQTIRRSPLFISQDHAVDDFDTSKPSLSTGVLQLFQDKGV